ncbi:MAG: hypothetical protein CMJ77_08665 [Planctomycetaceae bacterium]|nr:hypothetical protein [Planctomycetaceae bacterium]
MIVPKASYLPLLKSVSKLGFILFAFAAFRRENPRRIESKANRAMFGHQNPKLTYGKLYAAGSVEKTVKFQHES